MLPPPVVEVDEKDKVSGDSAAPDELFLESRANGEE